jgi:hypothetical protein
MYFHPGITPPPPFEKDLTPIGENGEVPLIPGEIPDADLSEEVGDL